MWVFGRPCILIPAFEPYFQNLVLFKCLVLVDCACLSIFGIISFNCIVHFCMGIVLVLSWMENLLVAALGDWLIFVVLPFLLYNEVANIMFLWCFFCIVSMITLREYIGKEIEVETILDEIKWSCCKNMSIKERETEMGDNFGEIKVIEFNPICSVWS